jgi:outer membrane protein OmpU
MTNLKKIGLTALAGSLVATSAFAGAMSVSGSAKMSYTGKGGNEDTGEQGNRFGLQKSMSFIGSGELDNGHTITVTHVMSGAAIKSSSFFNL